MIWWRIGAGVLFVAIVAGFVVWWQPYYGGVMSGSGDRVLVQYSYKDMYECEKNCEVMEIRTR